MLTMSVTFSIRGTDYDLEDEDSYLNVHNGNAREILDRLDIRGEDVLWGSSMRASELATRCRAALQIGPMLHDLGHEARTEQEPGRCKVIHGGRPPGRINEHIRTILDLCARAGDLGVICWG
jgi:hypothetical protein